MKRALRIAHFDKNKKVKVLELGFDDVEINSKDFAEEGSLLLSIHSENQKTFFQLSTAEAALLKERLDYILALLAKQYIEADEKAAKTRQSKNQQKKNQEEGEEVDWEEDDKYTDRG
ncbi:conserved hypothetical protein [Sulfolobus islandicus Y.G.57.14]|uniref:Uncharacterized protein n=1 Tax=Saccharolobus islandicus (strain Y.G.57.14 / Yellowstone \|nr:hypothetical protein [Sulfolobus islandicus]ACP45872.1 conserved hypothetical protein [Sulfolobus islandicus Y.G.57.14]